jgi:hypothetical protein
MGPGRIDHDPKLRLPSRTGRGLIPHNGDPFRSARLRIA